MKIEFDKAKSEGNARERGLPFELVEQFEWESSLIWEDARFSYPETRFMAVGFIGARLHVVIFTALIGAMRVISLRKANSREVRKYEKEKTAH